MEEQEIKTKQCKKCGKELEISEYYFPKDKACIDGFRNVCKECKNGKFGISKSQKWTENDISILMENYPYMSNKEIVEKYLPTRTESKIGDYAIKILKLHKDEEYLKYRAWSKEQLDFLIDNYSFTEMSELVNLIGKIKL